MTGREMKNLLDVPSGELTRWLAERGHPAYRCPQLQRWLFQSQCEEFGEMSNLPSPLRTQLGEHFRIWSSRIAAERTAPDGTEKLVLETAGGGQIECVLLRDGKRRSVCISSQVGCAMGCVFCASGLEGVDRNLSAGEIVEQMLRLARRLPPGERITHVVVMGMGEPLANLDHLLPALQQASHRTD